MILKEVILKYYQIMMRFFEVLNKMFSYALVFKQTFSSAVVLPGHLEAPLFILSNLLGISKPFFSLEST